MKLKKIVPKKILQNWLLIFLEQVNYFQIINTSNSKQRKSNKKKSKIIDFSPRFSSIFNNIILANNQKLMIFDGCSILFQTLLL